LPRNDKDDQYILNNGTINQEDIIIENITKGSDSNFIKNTTGPKEYEVQIQL
jgi:hypothetical protein